MHMKSWRAIGVATLIAASALIGLTPLSIAQAPQRNGPPFQVVEASIADIHAAYKSGALTARQLTQAYLDRIEAYDKNGPKINSVISLNPRALEEADRLDAAYKGSGPVGPLHGIPILIKDEIDTAGMATTMGTLVMKDYRPAKDAFVVDRLRKAGAIILGKTTLSEWARGDTYGSMFGVTRNPYDLERTVGGSSGGSGAALAANFSTVALGEETLASIRRPGGWNAVVSMRPTPGLVSRSGMWDGYPTIAAQMGPMARNVSDLARLLDVMVAYDPEDPLTAAGVGKIDGSYARFLDANGLKGARIGILRESVGQGSEPGSDDFKKVDAVFEKAIAELKSAGAIIVDPVVIPDFKALLAKRAADPALNDEALRLYFARNPNPQFKTRDDIVNSPLLERSFFRSTIELWRNPAPADAARYGEYLKAREQLMINILKVMADNRFDAIVHKTVEHQPTLIKDGINPPYVTQRGVPAFNTFLAYSSVITVPAWFTTDNLPVGITFFGRPYSEPTLIKLAYACEQATRIIACRRGNPSLGEPRAVSAQTRFSDIRRFPHPNRLALMRYGGSTSRWGGGLRVAVLSRLPAGEEQ
jgi:Asp-tRNA(Asn)/Glu-tRNA(Gln) amidotransferase A subunit family amidase